MEKGLGGLEPFFYGKLVETLELFLSDGSGYDFDYQGRKYRIAGGSSGGVSLWEDGREQNFRDLEELMERALIGDSTFQKELLWLPLGDLL